MFANHGEQDEICPLTTVEIAEANKRDQRSATNAKTPEGVEYTYIVKNCINTNCVLFSCISHLLSTDLMYSCVPGDQGGLIFSDIAIFPASIFIYKLIYYNL